MPVSSSEIHKVPSYNDVMDTNSFSSRVPSFNEIMGKSEKKNQSSKSSDDIPVVPLDKSAASSPTPSKSASVESPVDDDKFNFSKNKNLTGDGSQSIEAPNGVDIKIDEKKLPITPSIVAPKQRVAELQQKVKTGNLNNQDIADIAAMSDKHPEAVKAYVSGNTTKGLAYDNLFEEQKTRNDIVKSVNAYNKEFHTAFNPDEILSSAQSTADFLQKIKKDNGVTPEHAAFNKANTVFENGRFRQMLPYKEFGVTDAESFIKNTEKYNALLKDHAVQMTISEDERNGVPKDQTINKIAQRTNPDLYWKSVEASMPNANAITNPIAQAGEVYNKLFGTKEKDDLLNSQLGEAELQYTNQQQRMANGEISTGIVNSDHDLIARGQARLKGAGTSEDVLLKYPALMKQKIAQDVSRDIAYESGQLKSSGIGAVTAEEYKNKFIGAGLQDYANTMKKLGYLDNPKTRDIALSMLSDAAQGNDVFSDASDLGGIGKSFLQPFKELGLSVGDITQFRGKKDIYSDKLKDEMFPSETPGLKATFKLPVIGEVNVRHVLNTTANLAGMAVIAASTEGLGSEVGLSTKAAKSLGAYTSFGLPTYNGALKDSYNFLDNDVARTLYASISAVANAEGGRILDLGKIVRIPGVSENFAKMADGLSDNSITKKGVRELLSEGKDKYIDFAMKYGKNVTKGAATMAYFNISNNIEKLAFGDPATQEADVAKGAAHAFMDGVLGMSIMGGFGAVADMKAEKNTSYKSFIYKLSLNPDSAKDIFKQGLDDGTYTQPEYNEKVQILNTAVAAKKALDAVQVESNVLLNENQKSVFVANKTAEGSLQKRLDAIPKENEVQRNKIQGQIDNLNQQNNDVLDGLRFSATLEPLYDLFNAEKEYNAALDEVNNGEGSLDKVEAAKSNYDQLINQYFENEKGKGIKIENAKSEISKTENTPDNEAKAQPVDFKGLRDDDFATKYFSREEYDKWTALEKDNPDEAKNLIADKKEELNNISSSKQTENGNDKKADEKSSQQSESNGEKNGKENDAAQKGDVIKEGAAKPAETAAPLNKDGVDAQGIPVGDNVPAASDIPFEERTDKQHADYIKSKFVKEFQGKGVSKDQVDVAVALMDARAKATGKGDSWYRQIEDIGNGDFKGGDVKHQSEWKKLIVATAMALHPLKANEFEPTEKAKTFVSATKDERQTISKMVTDYFSINDEDVPQGVSERAIKVWELYGRPEILPDSTGKHERPYAEGEKGSIRIGNITDFDDFVAEIAHAAQFSSGVKLDDRNVGKEYTTQGQYDSVEYERKGSVEYDAHKFIEPYLAEYILTGKKDQDLIIHTPVSKELAKELKPVLEKYKIKFQDSKGALETLATGRKIIHALDAPDFSTAVHEIAHVFEDELNQTERAVVQKWAETKEWNTKTSEAWARGFERYLRDGSAPTEALKSIFQKAKEWLQTIYQKLKGSPTEKKITPEVKEVFDNLFKEKNETAKESNTNPEGATQLAGDNEQSGIPATETGTTETDVNPAAQSQSEGGGTEPPTPEAVTKDFEKAGNNYSAITKARTSEVEAAKTLFDRESPAKWTEIHDRAMEDLQHQYPDKSIYEAAKEKVATQSLNYDRGIDYNPTSKDIAVMQYLKAETENRLKRLDIETNDEATMIGATLQYDDLHDDLMNIAKASQTREAGTAFGLRNREVMLTYNSDAGLKARRIQLIKAQGGEKLTPEQNASTAEEWEKEKQVLQKENDLKLKSQQEQFDAEIARLNKEHETALKNKKPDAATKKEKTLSQKGKDVADIIRKLKIQKGDTALDITFGLRNLAVEAVATLVEAGSTIAEAIKEVLKDAKYKGLSEDELTKHIVGGLDRIENRDATFDKIKDFAETEKINDVTNDMVAKGFIKEFVDSYIGESEPKDILKEAAKELKKVLPDITEDRLREAYIKKGEFSQPTKKKLETENSRDKKQLDRLSKLEQDIADLKKRGDISVDKGNLPGAKSIDRQVAEKEKELQAELNKQGKKFNSADKYRKASDVSRSESHNGRIDDLTKKVNDKIEAADLSDTQKEALKGLVDDLNNAKITLNPESKLDQSRIVENGLSGLEKAKSKFDRVADKLDNANKLGALKKDLQRTIDKFNSDKNESEQNIKLQRTKDQLRSRINEQQRKLNAGEFEDKLPVTLNKYDKELVKLQIEKNKIDSQFYKKKRELEEKNKTKFQKFLDTSRIAYVASLIYKFTTLAKVTVAGLVRPTFEAMTKLTGGRLFNLFFNNISKAAKEGGESSSLYSVKKLYQAQFSIIGEKNMQRIVDNNNKFYKEAVDVYEADKKNALAVLDEKGADSKEFKSAQGRLQKSKNDVDQKMLKATSNILYEFIGKNAFKDAGEAFLFRSNKIERMFGYNDTEGPTGYKKGDGFGKNAKNIIVNLNNLNYLLGVIGRSHSAMKTFSGRASFAAGFVARLESSIAKGDDVKDNILRIAQESYMDWDRGKYQQGNFVTDTMNKVISTIGEQGEAGKKVAQLLKWDLPITRVPVNILHEAVMQYGVGFFTATIRSIAETRKANKEVKLNESLIPGTDEFKKALSEKLQNMDAKTAANIVRTFRKGAFGFGLYSLIGALGMMHFGGFYQQGVKKKKNEELEPGELNAGEIMFGDTKMSNLFNQIIEHTPAFYPALMGMNTVNIYKAKVEGGEMSYDAAYDAFVADLETINDGLPQSKTFHLEEGLTGIKNTISRKLFPPENVDDVDENGNLIKRKPLSFADDINLLTRNRGEVLSETNYRTARKVQSDYKKVIKQAYKEDKPQTEIDDLIKERDNAIKEIYKVNKEEYDLLNHK